MYSTFYLPIPMLDPGLVYCLVIETISSININNLHICNWYFTVTLKKQYKFIFVVVLCAWD